MDKYHVYSGKVGSCVGSRGLLGRVEHVRVVQMSVILESKFSLSYEVHSVLTLLCVCVWLNACIPVWQILFQKVELLWGSILTCWLHSCTCTTHIHTLFLGSVSHLSVVSFLQLHGFSFELGRWRTLRMKADPKSFWISISLWDHPAQGSSFSSTGWAFPALQTSHFVTLLYPAHVCRV